MSLSHGTLTAQRTWTGAPEHIFSAWSDPGLREKWFGGAPGRWTCQQHTLECRTGGQEICEGRLNDTGAVLYYEGRFHLVEPARRLIYAYDLHVAGAFQSVTLASLLLEGAAGKTHVTYTEQITFLDGHDGTAERLRDTQQQLDALEAALHLQRG